MKPKIIVSTLLIAVAALSLTGCANTPSRTTAESTYLSDVYRIDGHMKSERNAKVDVIVIKIGHTICHGLDQGLGIGPVYQVALGAASGSVTQNDEASMFAAAVQDICPSHEAAEKAYIAANS